MPKNKVVPIEEAMAHIKSGMSIAIGGFIGQGDPLTLIDHLKTMDVKDLTIYENDAGFRERGNVELVKQGKIKKIVASHVGTTPDRPEGGPRVSIECAGPAAGARPGSGHRVPPPRLSARPPARGGPGRARAACRGRSGSALPR